MKNELKSAEINLGVDEVTQMLFWSFYYSQGNPVLQDNILKYIKICYPEECRINLNQAERKAVVNQVVNMNRKYEAAGKHSKVKEPDRVKSITDEARNLFIVFGLNGELLKELSQRKDQIFSELFELMVQRDVEHIDGKNYSGEGIPWRIGDAMTLRSFVNKRVLPWPYSKLMDDITERLSKILKGAVTTDREVSLVRELINKHNKYHPEKRLRIVGKRLFDRFRKL